MESKVLFNEKQKFTQWWLWLLLIAPIIALFYNLLQPILKNPGFGEGNYSFTTIPSNDFWISLFIMFLVILLFLVLRLSTKITKETISIRFFPFFTKIWKWSDITEAHLVTYGFVGYGIRISGKYGMVYNVKGNKGLAITLKNGRKHLLGTQKSEQLEQLLQEIKSTN